MRAPLFLISLALSSAACSDRTEYAEQAGVVATASVTPQADSATTPAARSIESETERYAFAYSWPAEVSAIPELAEHLERRARRMEAGLVEEADQDWAAAEGQEWEPRQHSASQEWKTVADLPDWLSLSGHLATYSGGAHGMYGVESLVWDKRAKVAVEGSGVFASLVALERALGARLCAALDEAREKRRGTAIKEGSSEPFDQCPGLDEATILIGSSDGQHFDRIAVYFGPYVAGSYAEGAYELDFPVTASVLDAVRPRYASAFAVKR